MNKNIEALNVYDTLKLALEALDHNSLFTSLMPGYDGRIIEKAYKAINKSLAEQPAQQWCSCEPTECKGVGRCSWQAMSYSPLDKSAQQQEPVEYWTVADGWVSEQTEVPAAAWIYPEFWDHCKMVGCGTAYRLPGAGRQPLYTSPPAAPASQEEIQRLSALVRAQQITIEKLESQRQWVGLTDEQIEQCMKQAYSTVRGRNLELAFARAIEANLKEKNA